ncbi:MAG: hypothetical protein IT169_05985 [Bryobacterales bacterium]|nr:hypothetical protein [Bryobacterales bacterium]
MRRRQFFKSLTATGAFACAGLALHLSSCAGAPAVCDEDCLRKTMDGYLAALAAHDPRSLSVTGDVKYFEGGVQKSLGKGLWETAGGDIARKIYVPDPAMQSIAFMGTMNEVGQELRTYIGLRLQLKDGKIAEVETAIHRGKGSNQKDREARASWTELTPAADRLPRNELIERSGKYFDALQESNSTLAPFGPQCYRYENGDDMMRMMPPSEAKGEKPAMPPMPKIAELPGVPQGCNFGDGKTKIFPTMVLITNRRVAAVDETRNTVMWVANFEQVGHVTPEIEAWNKTVPPEMRMTNEKMMKGSSPVFEVFRIRDGKIAEVDAIF